MAPRIDSVLDLNDLEDDQERPGSQEKLSPVPQRASAFVEHNDATPIPRVWGRESQSGYKGRRVLGLVDDDEKSPYMMNKSPFGAYAPSVTESGKMSFPDYEMPQRYVESPAYRSGNPIPLAGNNNTWVPPDTERRRFCGIGKWTFWLLVASLCILVLGAIIGGMVAGISSAARKSSLSNLNAYTTSTAVSSLTNTMTLANGEVVVSTQVFTYLQTIMPTSTSSTSQSITTEATSSTPTSISKITATSTISFSTSSDSELPTTSILSSSLIPKATTTPVLLPLSSPSMNGTTAQVTPLNKA